MRKRLWSYSTGEKGLNRIRVYERRPNGPLYVEWYNSKGRHQRSLRALGIPIFDRRLAASVADVMAKHQRRRREATLLRNVVGAP